jgi:predicted dinucleotide-binding enzyme
MLCLHGCYVRCMHNDMKWKMSTNISNNAQTIQIEMNAKRTPALVDGEQVAIVGTGCYGLAIGKRLLEHGLHVTFASRYPNAKYIGEYLTQSTVGPAASYDVKEISEALRQALSAESATAIVFLAIRASNDVYESFVDELATYFANKKIATVSRTIILVELSNLDPSSLDNQDPNLTASNAERLAATISSRLDAANAACVRVVKAFNLQSAHSMAQVRHFIILSS